MQDQRDKAVNHKCFHSICRKEKTKTILLLQNLPSCSVSSIGLTHSPVEHSNRKRKPNRQTSHLTVTAHIGAKRSREEALRYFFSYALTNSHFRSIWVGEEHLMSWDQVNGKIAGKQRAFESAASLPKAWLMARSSYLRGFLGNLFSGNLFRLTCFYVGALVYLILHPILPATRAQLMQEVIKHFRSHSNNHHSSTFCRNHLWNSMCMPFPQISP